MGAPLPHPFRCWVESEIAKTFQQYFWCKNFPDNVWKSWKKKIATNVRKTTQFYVCSANMRKVVQQSKHCKEIINPHKDFPHYFSFRHLHDCQKRWSITYWIYGFGQQMTNGWKTDPVPLVWPKQMWNFNFVEKNVKILKYEVLV